MKWIKRGLLLAILALLVIAGLLAYNMGSFIEKAIVQGGTHLFGVPVQLKAGNLNPISGRGEILDLSIANPANYEGDTPALSVGRIQSHLKPTSLLSSKIHLPLLHIEGIKVAYKRGLESRLAEMPSDQESRFRIDRLEINHVQVSVSASVMERPLLDLQLPDIVLEDLGREGDGLTASEITGAIMKELMGRLLSEFDSKGWEILAERLDSPMNKELPDSLKQLQDKAKGLLNRFNPLKASPDSSSEEP
jgi:hypothetical protein